MPQIRQVVSEALQSTVRRLLPSQQGFTEDLMATNVITPIIDLTPTAEGSSLPDDLARAASFGNITSHAVSNATTTIINTAGFYRVVGSVTFQDNTPGYQNDGFNLVNGVTIKRLWGLTIGQDSNDQIVGLNYDFIAFLKTGDSLTCDSHAVHVNFTGSSWQVADVNGVITVPDGYSPQ